MFKGTWAWLFLALQTVPFLSHAQIDPIKRRLIQVGYNQPLEGQAPVAAYGFYYHNQPEFCSTNMTLRLAIAPVYVDGELGFSQVLGPNTDVAVGMAGGGFADSYAEIQKGVFERDQSFSGDGGDLSGSLYHHFNPDDLIPLFLVMRTGVHQSFYRRDSDTSDRFELPDDMTGFRIRTGLRWGGQEPSLTEPMAMEMSIWHEAQLRGNSGDYGYNRDRTVEPQTQLAWGRALLKYALNPSEQLIEASVTLGTSWEADRFSAYRLGGFLPFSSEFPLSIPGYYFQEISAKRFVLLNGGYSFPLTPAKNWRVDIIGATGLVDYISGLEQPGNWHSGVGGGLTYISPTGAWLASLVYGYGFEALRSGGRGADQVALLFQYDFEAKARGKSRFFVPGISPWRSQGAERIFH